MNNNNIIQYVECFVGVVFTKYYDTHIDTYIYVSEQNIVIELLMSV